MRGPSTEFTGGSQTGRGGRRWGGGEGEFDGFEIHLFQRAHDEKLWVVAPGFEMVHPGSASLNDLELLEVVVPVTIGPPDNVLGLLVG